MENKPSFLRHSGWLHPNMITHPIVIVGCGGVGSNVAMIAARMGFKKFVLYDADVVEDYNLANQQFFPKHIGKSKVEALSELLREFNPDIEVKTYNRFYTSAADAAHVEGFLIIATDSMKSRKDISQGILYNTNILLAIEARLGFEHGEIHVINPLNSELYRQWTDSFMDDSLIPEGPCNQRLCSTLVTTISAYMVQYICTLLVAKATTSAFKYPYGTITVMKDSKLFVKQYNLKEIE
jgi:molybdopterin/thiamine biosynthesis adenylyltransferase